MKVGDTVYILNPKKGKKDPRWCKCRIKELLGSIARLSVWDGSSMYDLDVMTRDLKEKTD